MLLPIITILSLLNQISAYFVSIDAHAEECFYEKGSPGTTLGLMFEVAEGGFLDIDVTISSPKGIKLHKVERESSGKFNFAAREIGMYSFCFSNKMSTMTPKIVMFTIEKNESKVLDLGFLCLLNYFLKKYLIFTTTN